MTLWVFVGWTTILIALLVVPTTSMVSLVRRLLCWRHKSEWLRICLGCRVLLVWSFFQHGSLLWRPSKILSRWHAILLIIVINETCGASNLWLLIWWLIMSHWSSHVYSWSRHLTISSSIWDNWSRSCKSWAWTHSCRTRGFVRRGKTLSIGKLMFVRSTVVVHSRTFSLSGWSCVSKLSLLVVVLLILLHVLALHVLATVVWILLWRGLLMVLNRWRWHGIWRTALGVVWSLLLHEPQLVAVLGILQSELIFLAVCCFRTLSPLFI
jgi:hypothetical protein